MKEEKPNHDIFIIFVLFFASLLLRIYNYNKVPVQGDELIFCSYTYSILAHGWSWPVEHMGAQPPLFAYVLAIVTYLFEGGLGTFRLVSIFFGCLTVCVIYLFGKSLYDRRVGMLAGILICFCSSHNLYSRTTMLEATWMFFAYTSMYFFWKSYKRDEIKYAFLSGLFLGLAFDTKYNAILLFISFPLFILWIERRRWSLGWQHIFKKKYLVIPLVSFFVFLPVLIQLYIKGANPFYWNLFGREQTHWAGYRTSAGYDLLDMLRRGFRNVIDVVIDGHSTATLSLPWLPAFYVAASLLLIIVCLYFLYLLLRSQPSGSFLMINFMVFYGFIVLWGMKFLHYLLWGLPLFLIMVSYLTFSSMQFDFSDRRPSIKGLAKVFVLILASIFILSYVLAGTMAPTVANEWHVIGLGFDEHVRYIKNEINPGDCIMTSHTPVVRYYLNEYGVEKKDIHLSPLYKSRVYHQREGLVNLKLIERLKPRFLIIFDYDYYTFVRHHEIIDIREEYIKISTVNDVSLYERKAE